MRLFLSIRKTVSGWWLDFCSCDESFFFNDLASLQEFLQRAALPALQRDPAPAGRPAGAPGPEAPADPAGGDPAGL